MQDPPPKKKRTYSRPNAVAGNQQTLKPSVLAAAHETDGALEKVAQKIKDLQQFLTANPKNPVCLKTLQSEVNALTEINAAHSETAQHFENTVDKENADRKIKQLLDALTSVIDQNELLWCSVVKVNKLLKHDNLHPLSPLLLGEIRVVVGGTTQYHKEFENQLIRLIDKVTTHTRSGGV